VGRAFRRTFVGRQANGGDGHLGKLFELSEKFRKIQTQKNKKSVDN
jgi:hypothetical protein